MDTWIDFFLFHLSVTDDHTTDLRIICIQPAGKHSGGDHLGFFAVRWFPHEFLINSGIIFIHPAFPQLTESKFLHAFTVTFICLRITFLPCNDACIQIGTLGITESIVVIGKIHQKRFRQDSPVRSIQCFHIIFIQPCDPDPAVHGSGKPLKIFRFSWISLHNIFTDSFHGIIRRKGFTSHGHSTVQAFVKSFLITGKICKAHDQLFRQHLFLSCKKEYLCPETIDPMQQRHICTNTVPCFQIQERACTSPFKKFLHQKDLS